MHQPDPIFPPLLTGHAVKSPKRAFEAAVRGTVEGEYGAGDFVWARNTARLDCAIVLEPDVSPARAAEMVFVALVAFGDSLGALAPPEVAVTYGWPTIIRVNGAKAGSVRAAVSAERDADGAPRWMVVGLEVEIEPDARGTEPGDRPDETSLRDEGGGEINRTELAESYSRHLLTWIHTWQTDGFRPVHELLLFRADGHRQEVTVEHAGSTVSGRFSGLDDHGNMLIETDGETRLLELLDILEVVGERVSAS